MLKFIDPHHDQWQAAAVEDVPLPRPTASSHSLLSLAQWHAVRDHWPAATPVGVLLPNTLDIEALAVDLPRLALLALQFPKWTDGRAYSQARLLRSRYRFAGDIRATGEVLVDMAPLLARTGFSSALLRHDQKREVAERTLLGLSGEFPGHYQGDTIQPSPAFARIHGRAIERAGASSAMANGGAARSGPWARRAA